MPLISALLSAFAQVALTWSEAEGGRRVSHTPLILLEVYFQGINSSPGFPHRLLFIELILKI